MRAFEGRQWPKYEKHDRRTGGVQQQRRIAGVIGAEDDGALLLEQAGIGFRLGERLTGPGAGGFTRPTQRLQVGRGLREQFAP